MMRFAPSTRMLTSFFHGSFTSADDGAGRAGGFCANAMSKPEPATTVAMTRRLMMRNEHAPAGDVSGFCAGLKNSGWRGALPALRAVTRRTADLGGSAGLQASARSPRRFREDDADVSGKPEGAGLVRRFPAVPERTALNPP
jgi:hypothetical protein